MKFASRIFAVLLLALTSCTSDHDGRDSFERFVHPSASDVQNLKAGRFSCMHCPWYFRFEASRQQIAELIKKHELTRIDHMSCSLELLMSRDMPAWWLKLEELPKYEKYWVEYRPKPGESSESRIKLAMVSGQTVFWVINGNFQKESFVKHADVHAADKWCRETPGEEVWRKQRDSDRAAASRP